ncbi:tail fiber protein [Escherichia coli]|uniref:gp53-like domain-containing protein n=2 Tax=Escherichia coli TaxID=562 RepID=UPI000DA50DEE|nr:tail fiber protein [Escherichia coli]
MAKNDFKAFATDRNANVMSQEEWEALPALISGFTAGKASSAQVNKVIRQASFIAAALAQFVSDKTQRDVLDNGDLPGFVELLGSGFAVEYLSRKNPFGDIKSDGTVQTALENLGLGEAAKRDVGTGAGQIPDMSAWSLPSGGVGMPNGIHFRYGYVTVTGDKVFSTPFPNQCFGIVFGQTYLNNEWLFGPAFLENSVNKNGFTFIDMGWSGNSVNSVIKAGERVFYIAIGN